MIMPFWIFKLLEPDVFRFLKLLRGNHLLIMVVLSLWCSYLQYNNDLHPILVIAATRKEIFPTVQFVSFCRRKTFIDLLVRAKLPKSIEPLGTKGM